jgi:hypothetical protein
MTMAEALLADLLARGIEIQTDGTRLRWRPAFMVTQPLAERILGQRAELIALLQSDPGRAFRPCSLCGRALDAERRCPRCFDRECEDCGRPTGSYFIRTCLLCQGAAPEG